MGVFCCNLWVVFLFVATRNKSEFCLLFQPPDWTINLLVWTRNFWMDFRLIHPSGLEEGILWLSRHLPKLMVRVQMLLRLPQRVRQKIRKLRTSLWNQSFSWSLSKRLGWSWQRRSGCEERDLSGNVNWGRRAGGRLQRWRRTRMCNLLPQVVLQVYCWPFCFVLSIASSILLFCIQLDLKM